MENKAAPKCPYCTQENRILTTTEIQGLEDKSRVWVEMRTDSVLTGVHEKKWGCLIGIKEIDNGFSYCHPSGNGGRYRVWKRRPTDDERAAIPWEEKNL